ncbi:MAG: Gfo/Idh/MocA family oxidoreductase [Actinomycetota bacterium]|nr:Gfo/Idh/MocA family oxidoreductase [Actinomycetota bacterium]
MEKLKAGVIGSGFFGRLHSKVISESESVKLVAIADKNKSLKKNIESFFNCNFYDNYMEMIEKEKLDFVSICTPDDLHVEPCVFAAENKVNILLEKPMARTVSDCHKIMDTCKKNNTRIMIAHLLRFDPAYKKLFDCVSNGDLGEVLHLSAERGSSKIVAEKLNGQTSLLFYIGVHDIDIAQWITGKKITKVYAQKVKYINNKWNMDDCISVLANFGDRTIGNFQFSLTFPKNFPAGLKSKFEIYCSKGTAFLNKFNQGLEIYKDTEESFKNFSEEERWTKNVNLPFELVDITHWPDIYDKITGDLKNEIDHFISCLSKDKEFSMNAEDATSAVNVIEHIFKSISENKPLEII